MPNPKPSNKMQLFYQPDLTADSKEVVFSKEESKHISKVLRKIDGDLLNITNGKGLLFDVELTHSEPKKCIAVIIRSEKKDPLPYNLHMAVAPTKLNDRYEWFLEKATEIGVSEITPLICDNSERKVINFERYTKKLQNAMKQSLKTYLPKLNPSIPFNKFIRSTSDVNDDKFIAHCKDTSKGSLKERLSPYRSVVILIGPEGDFSEKEVSLAEQAGYFSVDLGKSRLRTETAAIVACHRVSFINE
jgi:16S rRNA (uracil1498-N3)-methyltransferase